jgi:hypothetical protein
MKIWALLFLFLIIEYNTRAIEIEIIALIAQIHRLLFSGEGGESLV